MTLDLEVKVLTSLASVTWSTAYASAYFTALTRTFDFEKVVRCDEAKDQIKYDFSPYESITSCIFLIVVNV
jgi:hypothetical protein